MWPLSDTASQTDAIGYTALVGGALFFIGSYLALLEALNAPLAVEFGHEIAVDVERLTTDVLHHPHHKARRPSAAVAGSTDGGPSADSGSQPAAKSSAAADQPRQQTWRWWGYEPRQLSYWLAILQFIGATIFGMSACITGVPNVLPSDYDAHYRLWDYLYWLPQVIGAPFFIINGLLTMVEVSGSWLAWKPFDLGWHVGFWNALGGIGFLLSGAFGFLEYPAMCCQLWGTAFSTFWGSIFFLMSSYLLLPEMLNK
eukprot:SM000178S03444  [mRNA]  locus=s178:53253:54265:- [translate_table: standard]